MRHRLEASVGGYTRGIMKLNKKATCLFTFEIFFQNHYRIQNLGYEIVSEKDKNTFYPVYLGLGIEETR